MLDKATALSAILEKLKKLPLGHCLDLRTYKRNRSVLIVKRAEDVFWVREDGFRQAEYEAAGRDMKRLLKTLLKKEFPRSTKIRVYALGEFRREKAGLGRKVI